MVVIGPRVAAVPTGFARLLLGLCVAVSLLLAVGTSVARAAAMVSVDPTSSGALTIDPTGGSGAAEGVFASVQEGTVVQYMPVTKVVSRVAMGPFMRDPSCSGDPYLNLAIYEYLDGSSYSNDTQYIGESEWNLPHNGGQDVTTTPGILRWTLHQPVTLQAGHTYLFASSLVDGSCNSLEMVVWPHGGQVDAGPYPSNGQCPHGPWVGQGNSDVGMMIYNDGGGGQTCANATLNPQQMPVGWLAVDAYGVETTTGSSSSNITPCSLSGSGAKPVFWRTDPGSTQFGPLSDYWCTFSQFGQPGQQLAGGWFWARPWAQDGQAFPQDIYLSLNDNPEAALPTGFGGWNPSAPNLVHVHCGDPVDCATGNLFETQTDISVPFHGLALGLSRTYNSQAAATATAPGVFGYGWSSILDTRLVIDQSRSLATVYQANGSAATFYVNANGSFSAPGTWMQSTLVKQADGTYLFTLPDRTALVFDSSGRFKLEADRNGNTIAASYDGSGHATSLSDGAGRSIALTYNPDGTVSSAQDPDGHMAYYSYSSQNLTQVTEVDGGQWKFGYDSPHLLTSMTDPDNHQVTTVYDSSNRVISQTDAMNRKRTWSYLTPSGGGTETVITNPAGDVTDELFNSTGEPTQITHALGTPLAATAYYTYDGNGLETSYKNEDNKTWLYGYDAAGNRNSVTDPLGHQTLWTYDAQHDLTQTQTPLGHLTTIAYDANGNRTSVSRTLTETGQTQTTGYGYNLAGDLESTTDALHHTWTYGTDAAGDRTSTTTPNQYTTTATYDADGNVISTVAANGNGPIAQPALWTTTITVDAFGRPTDIKDPLGHHTTMVYDSAGNLTDSTDRDGRHTQYVYNADNELTSTIRPDQSTVQTGYDADGQMTSQTDGNNQLTTYDRNAREQIATITDPKHRQTQLAYDPAGQNTTVTDAANRTTTYTYNDAGELTKIHYSSGNPADRTYSYDADGNQTGVGSDVYTYDSLDRLVSTANQYGQTAGYTYNLNNQVTNIAYPKAITPSASLSVTPSVTTGTVTRVFDPDGNLTKVTDWLSHTTTYGYDANGNLTSAAMPDGTNEAYGYNNNDQLTSINDTSGGGFTFNANYTRTPGELLQTLAETNGTSGTSQTFTYDSVARLKTVATTSTPTSTGTYGYDNADNLITEPTTTGTATQTYDAAHQLTSSTDSGTGVAQAFTYDQLGERTSQTASTTGAKQSYSYDQDGQLSTYTSAQQNAVNNLGGGTTPTATYSYGADGLRTDRYTNNLHNLATYDHTSGLPLLLTDGATSYIYGPDQLPLEQISATGTVSYYHHDQLGSTRALTDSNGHPTNTYNYDAYGNLQGTTAAAAAATNPLLYAGQYTDPESGLQYLRARYYDPATGQLITSDPLTSETRQPYSYANDNPINGADPTGLDCGLLDPGGCVNDLAGTDVGGDIVNTANQLSDYAGIASGACALTMFWNGVGEACLVAGSLAGAVNAATDVAQVFEGCRSVGSAAISIAGDGLLGGAGSKLFRAGSDAFDEATALRDSGGLWNRAVGGLGRLAGQTARLGGATLNASGNALSNINAASSACGCS
jgi:RHS repeat-associated protein